MFFSPIFILYYARYIDNTSCHRSKYYLYYYDMIQIGRILLCLYCQRNWMKLIEFSKVCDLQKICYSCFLMSHRYLLHGQYMLGFVSFLMIHYLLYLVVFLCMLSQCLIQQQRLSYFFSHCILKNAICIPYCQQCYKLKSLGWDK